jgi:thiamine-monophosphate kinase
VLVEGRHFRLDWSTAEQIGAKAAAASLADLAAMGGAPVALVVGFGAPARLPASWAIECARGIEDEARRADAHVVGGDVTASDAVTISVTGIGDLQGRAPVLRSGAEPGNVVAICGRLGWSAAGLDLLRHDVRAPREGLGELLDDHRHPHPPYSAGILAAQAGATAMIDISDGLVADARHIAQASGVRIDLSWEAIEDHLGAGADLLRAAAAQLPRDAMSPDDRVRDWVLHGGEDHGLLAFFGAEVPDGFTVIGEVRSPAQGVGVWVDNQPADEAGGHEHYRSR